MERNKEFDKHLIEILAAVTTMLQFDYSLIESDCFVDNIHSRVLKMDMMVTDAKLGKKKSA